MNADFGMFYAVVGDSPQLYPSVDVIDTFIFRSLRKIGDIGMSSAAGFYQSCLAFVLILICNGFARKYQREGAIF
jgi:putative aldouronate transport system permease protein